MRMFRVFTLLWCFFGFGFTSNLFACCEEEHFYSLNGVKVGDVLNIRQFPSPKAPIVGKIPAGTKKKISIQESSALEVIECIKEPLNDPKINDTFKSPEDEDLVKPYKSLMLAAPGENRAKKTTWCWINFANLKRGWVNASYLKYDCTETVGDTGGRSRCEKRAAKSSGTK